MKRLIQYNTEANVLATRLSNGTKKPPLPPPPTSHILLDRHPSEKKQQQNKQTNLLQNFV